jgi:hypothetical protein
MTARSTAIMPHTGILEVRIVVEDPDIRNCSSHTIQFSSRPPRLRKAGQSGHRLFQPSSLQKQFPDWPQSSALRGRDRQQP